jgi:hypothetical protein
MIGRLQEMTVWRMSIMEKSGWDGRLPERGARELSERKLQCVLKGEIWDEVGVRVW